MPTFFLKSITFFAQAKCLRASLHDNTYLFFYLRAINAALHECPRQFFFPIKGRMNMKITM